MFTPATVHSNGVNRSRCAVRSNQVAVLAKAKFSLSQCRASRIRDDAANGDFFTHTSASGPSCEGGVEIYGSVGTVASRHTDSVDISSSALIVETSQNQMRRVSSWRLSTHVFADVQESVNNHAAATAMRAPSPWRGRVASPYAHRGLQCPPSALVLTQVWLVPVTGACRPLNRKIASNSGRAQRMRTPWLGIEQQLPSQKERCVACETTPYPFAVVKRYTGGAFPTDSRLHPLCES